MKFKNQEELNAFKQKKEEELKNLYRQTKLRKNAADWIKKDFSSDLNYLKNNSYIVEEDRQNYKPIKDVEYREANMYGLENYQVNRQYKVNKEQLQYLSLENKEYYDKLVNKVAYLTTKIAHDKWTYDLNPSEQYKGTFFNRYKERDDSLEQQDAFIKNLEKAKNHLSQSRDALVNEIENLLNSEYIYLAESYNQSVMQCGAEFNNYRITPDVKKEDILNLKAEVDKEFAVIEKVSLSDIKEEKEKDPKEFPPEPEIVIEQHKELTEEQKKELLSQATNNK